MSCYLKNNKVFKMSFMT